MDAGLVSWARRVKRDSGLPPLWLFSDAARMPDLCAVVENLPAGLCGVVFRHDGVTGRAELERKIAKICRRRRLALVVAGDARLAALGAGVHLRGGRRPGFLAPPPGRLVTSSAHNIPELLRARRARAKIVFCGPVFATLSHPGAAVLGVFGFCALARRAGAGAYALGGIDGRRVRVLGKFCAGAGAIGALLPSTLAVNAG